MISLICIDVDGTLVGSSGTVSDRVWNAAQQVRDRGIRLALCTGRPSFGIARSYAVRLDPTGWHVFQNGASIVGLPAGDTRSRMLPREAMLDLVRRARESQRPLELYGDTEYAVELDTPRTRAHAALLGIPFRARDLLSLPEPVVRAQWVVSHAEAEVVMREAHAGLDVAHSLSPVMPNTSFLNITPEGVDKAGAVRLIAAEYALAMEQVMMVGDGANDISTMRAVGVSVAMGNAEPSVLAAAGHVVGHVDADGLIEAFALALTV